jgi:hypothetical protein
MEMSRLFLSQNVIIFGAFMGILENFHPSTSSIDNLAAAILNLRT